MSLAINKNQPSFTSKMFPVAPFSVVTTKGKILIKELAKEDLGKAVDFSINQSQKTYGPIDDDWKNLSEIQKILLNYKTKQTYREVLNSEEGTILVGMDEKSKDIKAFFLLKNIDDGPLKSFLAKLFDGKKIGFFEEFMVDEAYRGQGLGKICVDKLLESAKPFSQIFLAANNAAVGFYKRAGFEKFNIGKIMGVKSQDKILKALLEGYDGTMVTPMVKVLD